MAKYTPLKQYLKNLDEKKYDITLTFDEIAQILNDKLPPSAFKYSAWWANEREISHV